VKRSNEAPPLPFDYGALIKRTVGHLGCEITIEPGRLIVGNAGLLVTRGREVVGLIRLSDLCDEVARQMVRTEQEPGEGGRE